MRGLPDSAVYGTYKRLGRGMRRRSRSEVGLLDLLNEWLENMHKKEDQKRLKEIRGY